MRTTNALGRAASTLAQYDKRIERTTASSLHGPRLQGETGEYPGAEGLTRQRLAEVHGSAAMGSTVNQSLVRGTMTRSPCPDTHQLSSFLELDLEPTTWLVEQLIPAHGLMSLASAPKVGKSMLAMHLVRSLASGDDFLGFRTAAASTLYIAEEGGAQAIQGRFRRLEESDAFGPCTVEPVLAIHQQLSVDTPEGIHRFETLLEATRPALVVIDCLVWIRERSENRSEDMAALMAILRRLATDYECTVLFIHHTAKGREDRTGYSMRGSGVLGSSTEGNLSFRRERNGIRLDAELREGEGITLHLRWDPQSGIFGVVRQPSRLPTVQRDIDVEGFLKTRAEATVTEMSQHFAVSDTAIRNRLRAAETAGRVLKDPVRRGRELVYRLRAA